MKVKNSRFIGSLGHTPTIESAREYINCIKSRFPDARHHCYAFCIGHGASVTQGMSDDGEPSGTAGWCFGFFEICMCEDVDAHVVLQAGPS